MTEGSGLESPRGSEGEPISWIGTAFQNTSLRLAFATVPGALVLMAYSIQNGFFAYLVTQVSTLGFIYTSCAIVFVLAFGIVVSAISPIWILILLENPVDGRLQDYTRPGPMHGCRQEASSAHLARSHR